jgi:hypothetical protein
MADSMSSRMDSSIGYVGDDDCSSVRRTRLVQPEDGAVGPNTADIDDASNILYL